MAELPTLPEIVSLKCPNIKCNGTIHHIISVDIFNKITKDDLIGMFTHAHGINIASNLCEGKEDSKNNITIGFYCESCNKIYKLYFFDHEGKVMMEWFEHN